MKAYTKSFLIILLLTDRSTMESDGPVTMKPADTTALFIVAGVSCTNEHAVEA